MYLDVCKEFGDVPVVVANDGDVTALAGAMDLDDNAVLGVAMGTSEAGGYVDPDGNIALFVGGHQPDSVSDRLTGYSCLKVEL